MLPQPRNNSSGTFFPSHSDDLLQALLMFPPGPEKAPAQLISVGKVTKKEAQSITYPVCQSREKITHTHTHTHFNRWSAISKPVQKREKHNKKSHSPSPLHMPISSAQLIQNTDHAGVRGLGCRNTPHKTRREKRGGEGMSC